MKDILYRRCAQFLGLAFLLLAGSLWAESPLPQNSYFVANLGQWDGAFAFKFSQGTTTYFLTETGMSLDLREAVPRGGDYVDQKMDMAGHVSTRQKQVVRGHVLRLSYINANPHPEIIGDDLLSHYSNYFLSRDSCKWRGHVPHYQKVIAKEVWPGIDVEYRASEQGIETAYHVKPYVDASQIQLNYEGQDGAIAIDANGKLHLQTSLGPMIEEMPFAFQIQNHLQSQVPVQFYLLSDDSYGFVLGNHDPSQEVVIDPLVYSTYYPNEVNDLTVDRDSNKIICGTDGGLVDFPTTPGAYQEENPFEFGGGTISKFIPDGTEFLFSTYFGGGGLVPGRVRADTSGNIYYFTRCDRNEWPLTADAFDTIAAGAGELGLARLSADGSTLQFSSFLGGTGDEQNPSMELDSLGRVYLMGTTQSTDFPITANAWFPALFGIRSAFLAIFDPATSMLLESTYFIGAPIVCRAGSIQQVISPGRLWLTVTAWDSGLPVTEDCFEPTFYEQNEGCAYFAAVDLNAHRVDYGSYLTGRQGSSISKTISADSAILWLFGVSNVANQFDLPEGGYQDTIDCFCDRPFIVKLRLPNTILYSTYLGGSHIDYARDIIIEPGGTVLLVGETRSDDFPTTSDAFQGSLQGESDVFLARMSPHLDSLLYGTYLGGEDRDGNPASYIVCQGSDQIWLCGATSSHHFPVTPNAQFPEPWNGFLDNGYLVRFSLPLPQDTGDATNPFILPPSSFSLSCYPNPFNPTTRILFTLPKAGYVDLNVYDVTGRLVRKLAGGHIGPPLQAGEHRIEFDGSDLPSGIYFARLEAGDVSQTRKMVLLK